MLCEQRSQGQAVSTSKHGSVCAQGCCHSQGTSGQDPREVPPGKQELLWTAPGHHKHRWTRSRTWGASIQRDSSPHRWVTAPISTSGSPTEVCVKAVAVPRLIKGIKVLGDRTEVHGSVASRKPLVLFHSRNGFKWQDLLAQPEVNFHTNT